jgi:glycosyltransferase involved in cell wall biosynthesis
MKILILSKAMIIGAYQRQMEILGRNPNVDLVVVVPPHWREPGVGKITLERAFSRGYRLLVHPIALNGRFHVHFWPGLGRLLRQEKPDILHIDEESFNLATFQALWFGKRLGARCLFFNWANLHRPLPPPFSWMERYVLTHADYAVAGNQEAAVILVTKGYRGKLSVIPQVGVDADRFRPASRRPVEASDQPALRIGYVGRLVPQKGISDLLEAVAGLPPGVQLVVVGDGIEKERLEERVTDLSLTDRVEFTGRIGWKELPDLYRRLDVLVLPSRTWPNWKEQFGRVLIEAMASEVAVVGSDSGEIPNVIGEAGLIFPEGDVVALQEHLRQLLVDPAMRQELGRQGRQRVWQHYSQKRVAEAYLKVYREMLR